MTSSWFNAAFHCFTVILIIHIKHLFTLFLNFYIQSTLNYMTSCHGATPTVNSRCTNPVLLKEADNADHADDGN